MIKNYFKKLVQHIKNKQFIMILGWLCAPICMALLVPAIILFYAAPVLAGLVIFVAIPWVKWGAIGALIVSGTVMSVFGGLAYLAYQFGPDEPKQLSLF